MSEKTDAAAPSVATLDLFDAASAGNVTPEQEDKIHDDEVKRIEAEQKGQGAAPVAADKPADDKPADDGKLVDKSADELVKIDDTGRAHKPDGTFAPKTDAAPVKADDKPKDEPVKTAVEPAKFDADKFVGDILAKIVHDKEYEDGGQKVKGEQLLKDYGQVFDPMKDALAEITNQLRAEFQDALKKQHDAMQPIMAQAEKLAETEYKAAEKTMMAALEEIGVSDVETLVTDPRVMDFRDKNPQYAALLSTDPDKVEDAKVFFDRARAALGIKVPEAKPTDGKPATAKAKDVPRSLLAAGASTRGPGTRSNERGGVSEADEDRIDREERAKIAAEQGSVIR